MLAKGRILIFLGPLAILLVGAGIIRAGEVPAWLPRYDLNIRLDVDNHLVNVRQQATWTNRHQRPTRELVFNAHAHYSIPDQDVGLLAKMVEILRMSPKEALIFDGPPLDVKKVTLLHPDGKGRSTFDHHPEKTTGASPGPATLPESREPVPDFHYPSGNATALVVPLPREVLPGESVTVELEFVLKLPQKKGRWGQWDGVTTLAQWLPVLAFYDEQGWQPAPFIPWHQPFFNEAGWYSARITLPADQKLACSGAMQNVTDLGDGWQQMDIAPLCVRDFTLVSSARFQEHLGKVGDVRVRCLALPEHAFYAEKAVQYACEALPVYQRWFGPYPYPQFTLVEAYFGWNGNECGALVMIDQRMFGMPHMAQSYIDYLVSHELCHQWWYNVVGTNGYAETFMDEGLATFFSHRLIDRKRGKNNKIIDYPSGLGWLPNIQREDFRNYGYIGVQARGDNGPTVQEMPRFGHLVNLSAMTYDRGSKIVGMIEQRLGETAFFDFMHLVYTKYQYQILRVADFQKELEAYTGRSWDTFFQQWLYSKGSCDWSIAKVEIDGASRPLAARRKKNGPVLVRVFVDSRGEIREPTVLGIRLEGQEGYQVRIPLHENLEEAAIPEVNARIRKLLQPAFLPGQPPETHHVVEVELPCPPSQISIDPDNVLIDSNPTNNHWKQEIRWRLTPLYTQLDEVDVTNSYNRWNFLFGPWFFANSYADPWFQRSQMAGFRVGAYRTQEFYGGGYLAYRTNDRNIVAGVDALWDHVPLPRTQIGINVEKSLDTLGPTAIPTSRGVIWGRYIMMYGSSLYMLPFEFVETFALVQNRSLPLPHDASPGADLFTTRPALGLSYHKFLLTPYWDPEGGIALDATYQYGFPIFGNDHTFQELYGQVSTVKYLPSWFTELSEGAVMSYLKETRFAFRLGGAAGLPLNGQLFTLGGGDYFRGFDLSQRQGDLTWVGSVEWRLPIARNLTWDFCDHVGGVRNFYLVPFYDIGNAYLNGHALGETAHAVGLGFRLDVAWLGLIERTMLRFDIAKTINENSPYQFWLGIQHPF